MPTGTGVLSTLGSVAVTSTPILTNSPRSDV